MTVYLENNLAGRKLSPRELEVLSHLVRGHRNKDIATAMGITKQTVKNHVRTVFRKLDVENRTQAATEGIGRGLVHRPLPWEIGREWN